MSNAISRRPEFVADRSENVDYSYQQPEFIPQLNALPQIRSIPEEVIAIRRRKLEAHSLPTSDARLANLLQKRLPCFRSNDSSELIYKDLNNNTEAPYIDETTLRWTYLEFAHNNYGHFGFPRLLGTRAWGPTLNRNTSMGRSKVGSSSANILPRLGRSVENVHPT